MIAVHEHIHLWFLMMCDCISWKKFNLFCWKWNPIDEMIRLKYVNNDAFIYCVDFVVISKNDWVKLKFKTRGRESEKW